MTKLAVVENESITALVVVVEEVDSEPEAESLAPFLGLSDWPGPDGIVKEAPEDTGVRMPDEATTALLPGTRTVEFTAEGKIMVDTDDVELSVADGVIVTAGMTVIVTVFSPLVTVLSMVEN